MYKFILKYKLEHDGNSPSMEEIMDACDVSSKSVCNYHLSKLEDDGLIERVDGQARSIVVVGGFWKAIMNDPQGIVSPQMQTDAHG